MTQHSEDTLRRIYKLSDRSRRRGGRQRRMPVLAGSTIERNVTANIEDFQIRQMP